MPTEAKQSVSGITLWAGKITGGLVIATALINSSLDLYRAVYNIPTSQSERDNKEYYEKYFGKKPVFAGAVPLNTDSGKVTISLEVHSQGDILVKYGMRSQWFPFPDTSSLANSFNLISSAYAENSTDDKTRFPLETRDTYKQFESQERGNIVRSKYYPNGNLQIITIDPITGNIKESESLPYSEVPLALPPSPNRMPLPPEDIDVYNFPEIDIRSK